MGEKREGLIDHEEGLYPLYQSIFDIEWIIDLANKEEDAFSVKAITEKMPAVVPKLRTILDNIIATGQIDNSKELKYFLKARERFKPKFELVDHNIEYFETREIKAKELYNLFNGCIPESVEQISVYLINSLQKADLRKLNKCELCQRYYIAKTRRKQKYCPICSPKNKRTSEENKEAVRKWRAEKKEKQKESFIRRASQDGWSREEAQEMWEFDQKM